MIKIPTFQDTIIEQKFTYINLNFDSFINSINHSYLSFIHFFFKTV